MEEDADGNMVPISASARPRRMSEMDSPPEPIVPIPPGSAFFLFGQQNRSALLAGLAARRPAAPFVGGANCPRCRLF